MTASAHLEITGAVIRVYEAGGYKQRSPYAFTLHLVGDDGLAVLKGLKAEEFERRHWKAINDVLDAHGFRIARWVEFKPGTSEPITVTFPISKKERTMSVQQAHQTASAALAKAIAEAQTANEIDLAAALQALSQAHENALPVAEDAASPFADRIARLVPLAAAVDGVKAAGLAHPDQAHPVHGPVKNALRACAAVAHEVFARELATLDTAA